MGMLDSRTFAWVAKDSLLSVIVLPVLRSRDGVRSHGRFYQHLVLLAPLAPCYISPDTWFMSFGGPVRTQALTRPLVNVQTPSMGLYTYISSLPGCSIRNRYKRVVSDSMSLSLFVYLLGWSSHSQMGQQLT